MYNWNIKLQHIHITKSVTTTTHFLDQFRSKLILKFRYSDDTIISTFFVLLLPVLPVIFSVILNESVIVLDALKSVIASLASATGSSAQY